MRTLTLSCLALAVASAAAGAQMPRVVAAVTGGRGTDYFHASFFPESKPVTMLGARLSVAPVRWRFAALALAGSAEQHEHTATYLIDSPHSRVRQWALGPELRLAPALGPHHSIELRAGAFAGRVRRTYDRALEGNVVDELSGSTSHPLRGHELGAGLRVHGVGLGYSFRRGNVHGVMAPPNPTVDIVAAEPTGPLPQQTVSFRRHAVELGYGFAW